MGLFIAKILLKLLDLDQTAQMHLHADLEICWSDVSWASLYISFKFFVVFFYFFFIFFFFFFFFFAKFKPVHFTYVYLL